MNIIKDIIIQEQQHCSFSIPLYEPGFIHRIIGPSGNKWYIFANYSKQPYHISIYFKATTQDNSFNIEQELRFGRLLLYAQIESLTDENRIDFVIKEGLRLFLTKLLSDDTPRKLDTKEITLSDYSNNFPYRPGLDGYIELEPYPSGWVENEHFRVEKEFLKYLYNSYMIDHDHIADKKELLEIIFCPLSIFEVVAGDFVGQELIVEFPPNYKLENSRKKKQV